MSEFNTIRHFVNLLVLFLLVIPVYYSIKKVLIQKTLIIVSGIYLLYVIAPRLVLFYIPFWIAVVFAHRLILAVKHLRLKNSVFSVIIVLSLAPMVLWKIFPNDFLDYFNSWGHYILWQTGTIGQIDAVKAIVVPIGLSFSTFRAIDFLIKTHIGVLDKQPVINVFTYGFFPPILIVGPVAEYTEVLKNFNNSKALDYENLVDGFKSILIGLIKIYVLAYPLSFSTHVFRFFDTNPIYVIWYELVLFTWYFYLNFAGFTDIAVGCAKILNIQISGNFNYPFFKTNLQQFWANWHMSLTRFAQRNIFIPSGGFRKKTQYRAVVLTMMVIALWHDLSISMIIFGVYHSLGLLFLRIWETKRRKTTLKDNRFVRVLKSLTTFFYVMLSFPLIILPTTNIIPFYHSLVGF